MLSKGSREQIAEQLGVRDRWIRNWLQQRREIGLIAPLPQNPGGAFCGRFKKRGTVPQRFSKLYAEPRASARAEPRSQRLLPVPDGRHTKTGSVLAALAAIVIAVAAAGQKPSSPDGRPGEDSAQVEPASPELARLEPYIGVWNVTETHFNARGDPVATVKGTEEITWILDRHAVRRVYTTRTDSAVFRAIGTLTWNDVKRKYHGVWFNNVTTAGATTVHGEWSETTRTFVYTLESSGQKGEVIRHQVVERFVDSERRVATTYRLKGAEVIKRMEVRYKRTIPCPDRIRPVFDDMLRPGHD